MAGELDYEGMLAGMLGLVGSSVRVSTTDGSWMMAATGTLSRGDARFGSPEFRRDLGETVAFMLVDDIGENACSWFVAPESFLNASWGEAHGDRRLTVRLRKGAYLSVIVDA